MAFTPSYIRVASVGSLKLTIGECNANLVSATDYWASAITDIVSVWTQDSTTGNLISSPGASVSFTASTGTIHFIRSVANTGSGLTIYILSGLAQR